MESKFNKQPIESLSEQPGNSFLKRFSDAIEGFQPSEFEPEGKASMIAIAVEHDGEGKGGIVFVRSGSGSRIGYALAKVLAQKENEEVLRMLEASIAYSYMLADNGKRDVDLASMQTGEKQIGK